jgi:hypothetical protein
MSARQPQRTGALLAGAAALALIASMFLDWYTLDLPEAVREPEADLPTFDAFEALDRADVAIVVAAGLTIIIAGAVLAGILARSPAPGVGLIAIGLFGLAVVIYRGIISPPGLVFLGLGLDMKVRFGWFVSVAAAAVMVVGGLLTYLGGPRLPLPAPEPEQTDGPAPGPPS